MGKLSTTFFTETEFEDNMIFSVSNLTVFSLRDFPTRDSLRFPSLRVTVYTSLPFCVQYKKHSKAV
jgi:hypothetical protein